jgi:AraC-like DNA-binding protein
MALSGKMLYNPDMPKEPFLPTVNSCGTTRCSPDWTWDTSPGLPDYDLIAIHCGTGQYRDGEASYAARAGACMLLRRGGRYSATMDPADPMTVSWVHFDLPRAAAGRNLPELYRVAENPPFLFSILDRVIEAHASGRERDADFWLSAVLRELGRQDRRAEGGGRGAERAAALAAICAEVRARPEARWRVAEMARRAYLSPDHFGRLFRRQVGCTPGEFVLRSRLDAAMGLLRTSSHSITRIAELLGYVDVCAFSRQFRSRTGMSPSEYRKG